MALGKAEDVRVIGKGSELSRANRRYSNCDRVSEDGVVRLAFMRSPACYGIDDPPRNRRGQLNPGAENRVEMACQDEKAYSDYRLYWLVFWVNRTMFTDVNPLRAIPSSILELPDSVLAVDIEKGRA